MDIEYLDEFFDLLNLIKYPLRKALLPNYLYGFSMLRKENKNIIFIFKTVIICVKLCEQYTYTYIVYTVHCNKHDKNKNSG